VIFLKRNIIGKIHCKDDDGVSGCISLLNKFKINHTCKNQIVIVDGHVKTSPFFEEEKFQSMLNWKLNRFGRCNIDVV